MSEDAGDVVISKGAVVEGKISCPGTVRVAGNVNGEVNCMTIVVQKGGDVSGTVSCINASISGAMSNKVSVEDSLSIDTTGIVSGDVSYGMLDIAKGGAINGNLNPVKKKKKSSARLETNSEDEAEQEESSMNNASIENNKGTREFPWDNA